MKMEMERQVIIEEINMVEDTPDDLVHEIFVTPSGRPPLGRPILGTEERSSACSGSRSRALLRDFPSHDLIFCASAT